jgi:hypothetical protein
LEKKRKKKTMTFGALEKTMKKKTKPMGVLEKTRIVKRRLNPCFLPKSCEHEGRKSKTCIDLQNTRSGRSKLFKSYKKPRR